MFTRPRSSPAAAPPSSTAAKSPPPAAVAAAALPPARADGKAALQAASPAARSTAAAGGTQRFVKNAKTNRRRAAAKKGVSATPPTVGLTRTSTSTTTASAAPYIIADARRAASAVTKPSTAMPKPSPTQHSSSSNSKPRDSAKPVTADGGTVAADVAAVAAVDVEREENADFVAVTDVDTAGGTSGEQLPGDALSDESAAISATPSERELLADFDAAEASGDRELSHTAGRSRTTTDKRMNTKRVAQAPGKSKPRDGSQGAATTSSSSSSSRLPLSPLPDPFVAEPSSSPLLQQQQQQQQEHQPSAEQEDVDPSPASPATTHTSSGNGGCRNRHHSRLPKEPSAAPQQPTEVVVAVRVRPEVGATSSKHRGTGGTAPSHSRSRRCLHVDVEERVLECVSTADPLLQRQTSTSSSLPPSTESGNGAAAYTRATPAAGNTAPMRFTFDTVFDEAARQDSVFDEVGRKIVEQAVLEGYHGTVLCYGQSGSGKTHTMIGPDGGSLALKVVEAGSGSNLHSNADGHMARNVIVQRRHADEEANETENDMGEMGSDVADGGGNGLCDSEQQQKRQQRQQRQQKQEPCTYTFGEDVGLLPRTLHLLFAALEAKKASFPHATPQAGGENTVQAAAHDSSSKEDKEENLHRTFSYTVTISALELYNEELRDLMPPSSPTSTNDNNASDPHGSKGGPAPGRLSQQQPPMMFQPPPPPATAKKLRIRDLGSKSASASVYVENLTAHPVRNFAEAIKVISIALKARQMGSTKLNEYSSRAHTLFFVKVQQVEEDVATVLSAVDDHAQRFFTMEEVRRREERYSTLTFADLAGSERVSHTGAVGKRLDEAKSINLSLALLGNVIRKLTDESNSGGGGGSGHGNSNSNGGSSHIPFRDSKLTRMLKDSFGGNCITYLLCNVSPDQRDALETVSTLRFAKLAKHVKNKPTSNITTKDLHGTRAALRVAESENACLRSENQSLKEQVKNAHEYAAWLEEQLAAFARRSTIPTADGTGHSSTNSRRASFLDDDADNDEDEGEEDDARALALDRRRYSGVALGAALAAAARHDQRHGHSTEEDNAEPSSSSLTSASSSSLLSRAQLAEECLELARKLHHERDVAASARAEAQLHLLKNNLLLDEIAVRDERIRTMEQILAANLFAPESGEQRGPTRDRTDGKERAKAGTGPARTTTDAPSARQDPSHRRRSTVVTVGPDGDLRVQQEEEGCEEEEADGDNGISIGNDNNHARPSDLSFEESKDRDRGGPHAADVGEGANRSLTCRRDDERAEEKEAENSSPGTEGAAVVARRKSVTERFTTFLSSYGFATRAAREEDSVDDDGDDTGDADTRWTGEEGRSKNRCGGGSEGFLLSQDERYSQYNYNQRRSKLEQFMDSFRLAVAMVRDDEGGAEYMEKEKSPSSTDVVPPVTSAAINVNQDAAAARRSSSSDGGRACGPEDEVGEESPPPTPPPLPF